MKKSTASIVLLLALFVFTSSCKHDPWVPTSFNPSPDDTVTTSLGCDPDTVYFVNDVLPIFTSSCAMSTCHDAISAREGVILTDYLHIMSTGHIHAGDPQTSSAYHSLNAGGENHMPPIGSGVVLTQDQKDAIYNWILQGAANNSCTETTCDSTSVSYSGSVVPILELYCFGCHSSTSAPNSGGGVALEPYSNLMTYVNNGFLIGDITHQNGYNAMPLGGNKLDDCKIGTIRNWINEGAQNN